MTEKQETPTLEVPAEETPVEETTAKAIEPDQIEALIQKLESAGVTTPEKLDGKLTASQEVGKMANLLGEVRAERDGVVQRLTDLEKAIKTPPAENDYDYSETPVDISSEIRKAMKAEREEQNAIAFQQQKQAMAVWNKIKNHKKYPLVKDKWDEKVKDPAFMMDVQSGQVNIVDEFTNMVLAEQDAMLKQSLDTLSIIKKGTAPATPHVEGDAHLPNVPTETEENEVLTKIKEKVAKGIKLSETEEMAALQATLQGS